MEPPHVYIPAVRIPQPDGAILIRAGKPVIVPPTISTREAARILGMSLRWVDSQCDQGKFKTAIQPAGPHGNWKIAREEVMSRLEKRPE